MAETLYNPFGEDDEDFELNELLNRHFKVAMGLVDEGDDPPELKMDAFWNKSEPELLDYQDLSEDNLNMDIRDEKLMIVSTL